MYKSVMHAMNMMALHPKTALIMRGAYLVGAIEKRRYTQESDLRHDAIAAGLGTALYGGALRRPKRKARSTR